MKRETIDVENYRIILENTAKKERLVYGLKLLMLMMGVVALAACAYFAIPKGNAYSAKSDTVRTSESLQIVLTSNGETILQENYNLCNSVVVYEAYQRGELCELYEERKATFGARVALDGIIPRLYSDLTALARNRYIAPVQSTVSFVNGTKIPFVYTSDKCGSMLDCEATTRSILYHCNSDDGVVKTSAILIKLTPTVTEAQNRLATKKLGTRTTYFADSSPNRKHNIRLAAKYLDGLVLEDGEVFSFNEKVGARSAERGFKEANIILNGELVAGTGGGVCQVSTTVFLAALSSGMTILNRAHHSLPVGYVPPGYDAMVSSVSDLRIHNTLGRRVYVSAKTTNDSITVTFYGKAKYDRVSIVCEKSETVPYERKAAEGDSVDGIIEKGRNGYKVLIKVVAERDGKSYLLYRELDVYTSKTELYDKDYVPEISLPDIEKTQ